MLFLGLDKSSSGLEKELTFVGVNEMSELDIGLFWRVIGILVSSFVEILVFVLSSKLLFCLISVFLSLGSNFYILYLEA